MKRQKLIDWCESLTLEELQFTCLHLTERLIETEDVMFHEDYDFPYWESCGERIDGKERTDD